MENNKSILYTNKSQKYNHLERIQYRHFFNALLDEVIKQIDFTIYVNSFINTFVERESIPNLINDLETFMGSEWFKEINFNRLRKLQSEISERGYGSKLLFSSEKAELSEVLHNHEDKIKKYIFNAYKNYFLGEKLDFGFEKAFKNEKLKKNILLQKIHFPAFSTQDSFNYMKILRRLHSIDFDECIFQDHRLPLDNIECSFDCCEFYNDFTVTGIKSLDGEYLFKNCHFIKDVNFSSETSTFVSNLFFNCTFQNDIKAKDKIFKGIVFQFTEPTSLKAITFSHCTFKKEFILNQNGSKIGYLNLAESTFEDKVKIQFCDIGHDTNFYNTKFKKLADYYQTKFHKVNFERTDFEKISVFSEATFYNDVDFKYTKFIGKAIFRDTVLKGKINLRNTIFDDEANFLDITAQKGKTQIISVSNRETARIIKNFYIDTNNIIESNKFYALEMIEREKELRSKNEKKEWLIFKIHSLSSRHSQDWFLALLWILVIGITASFYNAFLDNSTFSKNSSCETLLAIIVVVISPVVIHHFLENNFDFRFLIVPYTIGFYYCLETPGEKLAKVVNPFGKINDLDITQFIFKVMITYLIYQFIVSIRQNTRRK